MAKKKTAVTIDDINGSPAVVTTKRFALDGVSYVIDLDADNLAYLDELLGKFAASARNMGGRKVSPKPVSGSLAKTTAEAEPETPTGVIREWAQKRGYTVSPRGRLNNEVMQAYIEAHNPKKGRSKRR